VVIEREEVGCEICAQGVSRSYERAVARIRLRTLEDVHLRAWIYIYSTWLNGHGVVVAALVMGCFHVKLIVVLSGMRT